MEPTAAGRIIVIDDEKNITAVLEALLEREGFEAITFNSSKAALEALARSRSASQVFSPDLVITDLYMPDATGMDVLTFCQKNRPDLPVVMMTAFGTVEAAVSALKRGAFDFITKPFDQGELLNVVRKAVSTHQRRQSEPEGASPWTSRNPAMQGVFKTIGKIADSPTTVLITGESGTGKELVALEIHRNSRRAQKPFVRINCAAIPATLIESELFGFEKGAFTGAVSSKPGKFELAHEGTLFLDEVADMSLEMQVKLLRVLQEQEFERVGGVHSIKVDVRIITATNKDLDAEVKQGRFREDLFYRLNVVPVHLPPLRERREDIEDLAQVFVKQFNDKLGRNVTSIDPEVAHVLRTHPWPGNIRQLENVIERMVLMSDGHVLRASDLPREGTFELHEGDSDPPSDAQGFKEIVRRHTQVLERELIEKALEETSGNVTRAAERLGLSRKGLQLKIKELGLKRPLDDRT